MGFKFNFAYLMKVPPLYILLLPPPPSPDVQILGFYHAQYLHRLESYTTIKLEARHQHVNISVFRVARGRILCQTS